ncbi:VOC family protein [Dyella sp.]|uniref:VOC family protein n=1 Tax=Dyella sp. TaxID=1869338 RepID=UPI002D770342|nr:VOC family protein [Dyella sp.]HET7331878.1 VOC family protein [Dyella sp.]
MHIAHTALWTRDMEAAAIFWRDYFGAEVGEAYYSQRRPGFVSRFITLAGGGAKIELMTGPWIETAPAADHVGWDHIAVSLGNAEAVDRLAERCRADGLLLSPPRMTGDGFYEAVIAMPDGIPIEVTA